MTNMFFVVFFFDTCVNQVSKDVRVPAIFGIDVEASQLISRLLFLLAGSWQHVFYCGDFAGCCRTPCIACNMTVISTESLVGVVTTST